MAVLCRAYTSHDDAGRAVAALLDAGVPGAGIRVLMGRPPGDARTLPRGAFAGVTAPDDLVGGFAGAPRRAAEAAGAFAGVAADQRGGSFADADRETVTSYPERVEHVRVVGHRALRALLVEAGLDERTAARDAEALHAGRIVVLAATGDRDPAAVAGVLDQVQASSERRDQ
jgi:hypothetical protein